MGKKNKFKNADAPSSSETTAGGAAGASTSAAAQGQQQLPGPSNSGNIPGGQGQRKQGSGGDGWGGQKGQQQGAKPKQPQQQLQKQQGGPQQQGKKQQGAPQLQQGGPQQQGHPQRPGPPQQQQQKQPQEQWGPSLGQHRQGHQPQQPQGQGQQRQGPPQQQQPQGQWGPQQGQPRQGPQHQQPQAQWGPQQGQQRQGPPQQQQSQGQWGPQQGQPRQGPQHQGPQQRQGPTQQQQPQGQWGPQQGQQRQGQQQQGQGGPQQGQQRTGPQHQQQPQEQHRPGPTQQQQSQGQPRQGSQGQAQQRQQQGQQGQRGAPMQTPYQQQSAQPTPSGSSAQSIRSSSTASSTSSLTSPKGTIPRGTIGKPGTVEVNYLDINLDKMPPVAYHYDVEITPDKPKKFMRPAFTQFNRECFPNIPMAYDGKKSFYTVQKLPVAAFEKEIQIDDSGSRKISFKVAIKETMDMEIDLNSLKNYFRERIFDKPMRALQCIEVVLSSPCHEKGVTVGRSYYTQPSRKMDLDDGYEMWIGLFQAVILGDSPFLNVDISHKSFPSACNLVDYIRNNFRDVDLNQPLNDRDRYNPNLSNLKSFLSSLNVVYEPPACFGSFPRTYKVIDISEQSADKLMFTMDDGKKLTIAEYFLSKGYKLKYPGLNCLQVGSTVKKNYIPFECANIPPGQALNVNMIKIIFKTTTMTRKPRHLL